MAIRLPNEPELLKMDTLQFFGVSAELLTIEVSGVPAETNGMWFEQFYHKM